MKTVDGILEIDLPQLRATEEPYHSRLARMFREGSDILGKMVTEMYVRGLSTFRYVRGHVRRKVCCVPTVFWETARKCSCTWFLAAESPTMPGSVFFTI